MGINFEGTSQGATHHGTPPDTRRELPQGDARSGRLPQRDIPKIIIILLLFLIIIITLIIMIAIISSSSYY